MSIFASRNYGWAEQDVLASLDYSEDWADFLVDGDQIATSSWSATPSGLVLSNASIAGPITTIWLSGGTVGTTYRVANQIVTASGRRDVRYFAIRVTDGATAGIAPIETALFNRFKAVEQFKTESLAFLDRSFPIDNLTDDYIWSNLVAAEADASHELRVLFAPTVIVPEDAPASEIAALTAAGTRFKTEAGYDYDPMGWTMDNWGHLLLRQRPVLSIQSVKFTYPNPGSDVLTVPESWLRLDKKFGQLQFVPSGTLMGLGPLTSYLMQAMASGRTIPQMIKVRYTAGLENAARDYPDLIALVKRMAILRILKSAFLPQSGSISADGLSQSTSVDTAKWQDEIDKELATLRDTFHGVRAMVF